MRLEHIRNPTKTGRPTPDRNKADRLRLQTQSSKINLSGDRVCRRKAGVRFERSGEFGSRLDSAWLNLDPPLRRELVLTSSAIRSLSFFLLIAMTVGVVSGQVDYDFQTMIRPVPETGVFRSDDFDIWGGSPVKGDDGRYHLYYSRWPHRLGHHAWVTHSEIAHATSKSPFGPWEFQDVALPARGGDYWDGSCTHNPTVLIKNGRFYLYYMGNRGDGVVEKPLNWRHRNNQRIGVAVAESPDGPWERFDKPVVDISEDANAVDALCVSNPAVTLRPDGGVLMIYKTVAKQLELPSGGPVGVGVAIANDPAGPFRKLDAKPFAVEGERFAAEDPYVWRGDDRYWAIVKDRNGHFTGIKGFTLALFESHDGIQWTPAKNLLVAKPGFRWEGGEEEKLVIMERPQILFDDGQPVALFCAAAKERNKANGFNVQIPLVIEDARVSKP